MRKKRDGKATKITVLKTAEEVFAEKGFAGTSLKAISDRCGISTGLILHHFSNKQTLYQEVLKQLSSRYFDVLSRSGQGIEGEDFLQVSEKVLRETFAFWRNDTTYQRISSWAYLENQDTHTEEEARLTAGLAGVITRMQGKGQADPTFQSYVLLSLIIGPIHFWMRYRENFMKQLNLEETPEELDNIFLEQFLKVIWKVYKPEKKHEL